MILNRVINLIPLAMVCGFFVTLFYFSIALAFVADTSFVSELMGFHAKFTENFEVINEALQP